MPTNQDGQGPDAGTQPTPPAPTPDVGASFQRLLDRSDDAVALANCTRYGLAAAVWAAEALNTSLEFLADATSPGLHPLVKKAKDIAAGGVLVAAVASVIVGVIIFGPRILSLLIN